MIAKYPNSMRFKIETRSAVVFSEIGGGIYECVKNRFEDTEGELLGADLVAEIFNTSSSVSIKLKDGTYISTLKEKLECCSESKSGHIYI